ncbi:N-6 adenine-specific DNA methyltransferase 2 [Perkinsus chesapeaki]|uniref:N-6 adenine-specific DNA methyltransferase 2 n=1 Tax=Perkinsus chesapeaki TaxID=330153 RepID=A0A7J6M1M3_PERCH|nr:N-6 adenine-specific DNA methyltransferase 2 [Perkinsus chesapeaki]
MTKTKPFTLREAAEFNQYWYSRKTIETLIDELLHLQESRKPEEGPLRVACLSTPSVFFTIGASKELKGTLDCWLFDFDPQLLQEKNCTKFDYREPEGIPQDLMHVFDCVVIDPPFITNEVWKSYAIAAKLLGTEGSAIIGSSVRENGDLLRDLLGMSPVKFQPSIPNLVYQYDFFTNYLADGPLGQINTEV